MSLLSIRLPRKPQTALSDPEAVPLPRERPEPSWTDHAPNPPSGGNPGATMALAPPKNVKLARRAAPSRWCPCPEAPPRSLQRKLERGPMRGERTAAIDCSLSCAPGRWPPH